MSLTELRFLESSPCAALDCYFFRMFFFFKHKRFFDASSHLYKRVYPPHVCLSVISKMFYLFDKADPSLLPTAFSTSPSFKRKIEENNTPDTKDKELSSPPAKVRAIEESTSDPATSKANVLDVTPSTSAASQNTVTESNSETSEEREKMQ